MYSYYLIFFSCLPSAVLLSLRSSEDLEPRTQNLSFGIVQQKGKYYYMRNCYYHRNIMICTVGLFWSYGMFTAKF